MLRHVSSCADAFVEVTHELETTAATSLDQVRDHSLERGEERAQKSEDQAPGREVVVTVGSVPVSIIVGCSVVDLREANSSNHW